MCGFQVEYFPRRIYIAHRSDVVLYLQQIVLSCLVFANVTVPCCWCFNTLYFIVARCDVSIWLSALIINITVYVSTSIAHVVGIDSKLLFPNVC